MIHYQAIYPRLKLALAGDAFEPGSLAAAMKLYGSGNAIGLEAAHRAALARRLNKEFEDVPLFATVADLEDDVTVRQLAGRIQNASAELSRDDIIVKVGQTTNRWLGNPINAPLDPGTPLSLGIGEDRLRRLLVRHVGGFSYTKITAAWTSSEPTLVNDVIDIVVALRTST